MLTRGCRVTVTIPCKDAEGDPIRFTGFVVEIAHELHYAGKPERAYKIDTSDGRHYARASWIRRER